MPKKPQKTTSKKKSQPPKLPAFLKAYSIRGNVSAASDDAGCERSSHYRWLRDVEGYAEKFDAARQEYSDSLEAEAHRRAVDGVQRLKFWRGEPIMVPLIGKDGKPERDDEGQPIFVPYVEHEYSDTLLIFKMKGAMPEKYVERTENVNHNSHKLDEVQVAEITRDMIRRKFDADG